jgi:hypothetical protein
VTSSPDSWRGVQEHHRAWERITSAMNEIDAGNDAPIRFLVYMDHFVTAEERSILWDAVGDALTEIAEGRRRALYRHASWRRP